MSLARAERISVTIITRSRRACRSTRPSVSLARRAARFASARLRSPRSAARRAAARLRPAAGLPPPLFRLVLRGQPLQGLRQLPFQLGHTAPSLSRQLQRRTVVHPPGRTGQRPVRHYHEPLALDLVEHEPPGVHSSWASVRRASSMSRFASRRPSRSGSGCSSTTSASSPSFRRRNRAKGLRPTIKGRSHALTSSSRIRPVASSVSRSMVRSAFLATRREFSPSRSSSLAVNSSISLAFGLQPPPQPVGQIVPARSSNAYSSPFSRHRSPVSGSNAVM